MRSKIHYSVLYLDGKCNKYRALSAQPVTTQANEDRQRGVRVSITEGGTSVKRPKLQSHYIAL